MKSKNLAVLLVVVAVIVASYLIFSKSQIAKAPVKPQNQNQAQDQKTTRPAVAKVEVQAVPKTELPKDFPSDVSLEAGAEITLNFNAINAKGEYQASREFISKKTVAENYVLYQKILKDNGWTITIAKADAPAGSFIFAEKNNYKLNIRIYTDAGKAVRVSINNIISK